MVIVQRLCLYFSETYIASPDSTAYIFASLYDIAQNQPGSTVLRGAALWISTTGTMQELSLRQIQRGCFKACANCVNLMQDAADFSQSKGKLFEYWDESDEQPVGIAVKVCRNCGHNLKDGGKRFVRCQYCCLINYCSTECKQRHFGEHQRTCTSVAECLFCKKVCRCVVCLCGQAAFCPDCDGTRWWPQHGRSCKLLAQCWVCGNVSRIPCQCRQIAYCGDNCASSGWRAHQATHGCNPKY